MNLLQNSLYENDIKKVALRDLPWVKLENSVILITGATGLLGRFLIDTVMYLNLNSNLNCKVISIGRNEERAKKEFSRYWASPNFCFFSHDINLPLNFKTNCNVDYVIHLASNTHPLSYATDPIGTITANLIGTKNLLDFCITHATKRFVFASSNEVYGENRGDADLFDEKYCGYIDSNTLRAGYPESKRCGEALCQAYSVQKGIEVVIPRFTRSYGPTMLKTDTKAISQFIKNGVNDEDIILKSKGQQYYSYTYVADAVSGLFYTLLLGKNREAYNIADLNSNITLKELANRIANLSGTKVEFELPSQLEKSGYSKATKAVLNGAKLRELGWSADYGVEEGVARTIEILKNVNIFR